MNLEFIKPQSLGSLLMKSSQSIFYLRSPGSYLVRSYIITTVRNLKFYGPRTLKENCYVEISEPNGSFLENTRASY